MLAGRSENSRIVRLARRTYSRFSRPDISGGGKTVIMRWTLDDLKIRQCDIPGMTDIQV
jgi:hypothetical protein